jgi:hypothetical protein
MARNYESESDDDKPDFFEELEASLEERAKSLKKPETAQDAKALIALYDRLPKTKKTMCTNLAKKAAALVADMDEVMRVFVAKELRENYLTPIDEDGTIICELCELILDESYYEECKCRETRMVRFAEPLGCRIPEIDLSLG